MENKILLLEDDESLIDGLKYLLKKNNFEVEFVRSVQEALAHLIEIDKYDILLLDVTLPDGTGFEVCENLADEPAGNLDSRNSQDVMELLIKASRHYQQTILMITHNNHLTSMVDRVLRVTDGILTDLGGKVNEKLS